MSQNQALPKFTKTFDGRKVNIADMRESLRAFPSFKRAAIADDGTPYLTNCVEHTTECGCKIIGNGTIQFPLTIQFCAAHSIKDAEFEPAPVIKIEKLEE